MAPGGRSLAFLDVGHLIDGLSGPRTFEANLYLLSRLPRVLGAAIVGAGLAAAGCAFQATLRNPLAEPFTLGISSGASLAAVLSIRFGVVSLLGASALSVTPMLGAALAIYLVWRLGKVDRSLPPATMLLAGITIAMFCSAFSMLLMYTASFNQVNQIVRWMMGDLTWATWSELARTAVLIGIGLAVLLWKARDLNALSAGDDAAASVGVDPMRTTTLTFAVSALIVGAGIGIAGPIGFVGLMVPHAVRALVGPDHRVLLPTSMFAGAGFLAICDTAARTVAAPPELPVGILTALLGCPFFLYLLLRQKGRGRVWS
jgi:iron complex transport system permease protein